MLLYKVLGCTVYRLVPTQTQVPTKKPHIIHSLHHVIKLLEIVQCKNRRGSIESDIIGFLGRTREGGPRVNCCLLTCQRQKFPPSPQCKNRPKNVCLRTPAASLKKVLRPLVLSNLLYFFNDFHFYWSLPSPPCYYY